MIVTNDWGGVPLVWIHCIFHLHRPFWGMVEGKKMAYGCFDCLSEKLPWLKDREPPRG